MENQQKPSRAIHITLWIAQVVLAALLVMGAVMKFMPTEKIAVIMPWMGQVSPLTVRLLILLVLTKVQCVVLLKVFVDFPSYNLLLIKRSPKS